MILTTKDAEQGTSYALNFKLSTGEEKQAKVVILDAAGKELISGQGYVIAPVGATQAEYYCDPADDSDPDIVSGDALTAAIYYAGRA